MGRLLPAPGGRWAAPSGPLEEAPEAAEVEPGRAGGGEREPSLPGWDPVSPGRSLGAGLVGCGCSEPPLVYEPTQAPFPGLLRRSPSPRP